MSCTAPRKHCHCQFGRSGALDGNDLSAERFGARRSHGRPVIAKHRDRDVATGSYESEQMLQAINMSNAVTCVLFVRPFRMCMLSYWRACPSHVAALCKALNSATSFCM
jgi:hypothetical protein